MNHKKKGLIGKFANTRKKTGLKWKVFFYLLLFAGLMILLLWLFQICYLEKFYKHIKDEDAQNTMHHLTEMILSDDSDDLENEIDLLASESNLAILVTDEDGDSLYSAEYLGSGGMKYLPAFEFSNFVEKAKEQNGSAKIEFKGPVSKPGKNSRMGDAGSDTQSDDQMENGLHFEQNRGMNLGVSVVYVKLLHTDGKDLVLMVNTQLTPVTSTVETLKIQLLWISILLMILAIIMALLISYGMSRSIVRMTSAAKKLGEGQFDVTFEGGDYREVEELSATLNYAAKELGKTESLRRELIANVSHDLRTPLTMIIAYSEVMRDLPGENTPENIQTVIDESTRLSLLVNDMLDISKLQSGVLKIDESEYNLTESIEKVLMRYSKLKEQDGYHLKFEYQNKVWVKADESKLYQVIYNLVNNALNYTGDDKTVTVVQNVSQDHVTIRISDSGEGIPKEELTNVWERYYKVDKNHKRSVAGTGLGLSIVKNILDLHHAEYGVESEVGKGSTFWFSLPVVKH